jgi:hypothetical protein
LPHVKSIFSKNIGMSQHQEKIFRFQNMKFLIFLSKTDLTAFHFRLKLQQ